MTGCWRVVEGSGQVECGHCGHRVPNSVAGALQARTHRCAVTGVFAGTAHPHTNTPKEQA